MGQQQQALRVGFVGAGVISRVHALALQALPGLFEDAPKIRLVRVADVHEGRAADFSQRFGFASSTTEIAAITEADDIDLVLVATPPSEAPPVVVQAAGAGKHVFSEKPLAVDPVQARLMLDAAQAAGVAHQFGTVNRWYPALRAMKHLLGEGRLGRIRHARATFYVDAASDPDVPYTWRFDRRRSGGGPVTDTGTHLIDTLRFLAGDVRSVQAITAQFVPDRPEPESDLYQGSTRITGDVKRVPVDVEDAGAALLTLESGGYAVLETSRMTAGRRLSMTIEIYAERGSLAWDAERPDEFQIYESQDHYTDGFRRVLVNLDHPDAAALLVGVTDATGLGWFGAFPAMWQNFARAVRDGRPPSANFEDGLRAAEYVAAHYRSAAEGRTVDLSSTLDASLTR